MYKTPVLGRWISKYYRIPYGIIIPDPHSKNSGEKLGDIVQGYCKPGFFQRLFCHRIWRPKYYRYFDSWEAPKLPDPPYSVKEIKANANNLSAQAAQQPENNNHNKGITETTS